MEIAVIRLCVKLRRDKSTTPKIPRPRQRVNLGKRATVAPGQFASCSRRRRINNTLSGFSSCQTIEQFHQARLIRIAHGRFAIWLDPVRVLNPEVVMNLLPELHVSVDLFMERRWLGERFMCGKGWFVQLALSVSALPSKTNKFHKALPPRGLI